MTRIATTKPDQAPQSVQPLLDAIQNQFGSVPNFYQVLATSPAAAMGYAGLVGALEEGALEPAVREIIAVAIAARNGCEYCLAAHALGAKVAGVGRDDVQAACRFEATHPKTGAALVFVKAALDGTGDVPDDVLAAARSAGWIDAELVEMLAHSALNTFTNMLNRLAQTPVDMPKFKPDQGERHEQPSL